ncbi:alpha-rhamnosidase [Chitinophaga parva]|uniref:Alpha-rhamnosidase n=1 Tax=Chitinophaga parva TaxID=2169414 RepID=A0A2T7BGQ3_9BACT|nr:alpha-L-rhamnosidase N-terminal domain-containing protein [Chitinophaga parva]PUZ25466.1 alpha-rhamnosidase [Chitinophaga parva]
MKPSFCARGILLLLCLLFVTSTTQAQLPDSSWLYKRWDASWIAVPGAPPQDYGIYYFRRTMDLSSVPAHFPVYVSGDNRYKLFVNGHLVSLGPARADVTHWRFEVVDLAPYLKTGQNAVAAQVWNEGPQRPEANMTLRTAFILQGASPGAQVLNTGKNWRCIQDSSYAPIRIVLPAYYVAGPGEQVNMEQHLRGWDQPGFDDRHWPEATSLDKGFPKYKLGFGETANWRLLPSPLPQMELRQERLKTVCRAEGVTVPDQFLSGHAPVTIPAHTKATILLDQSYLTNAYPTVTFSGGKGGSITLCYGESLFSSGTVKGNRNEIAGKFMRGRKDSILADGSAHQSFTSLSWRTFRYLQLSINTGNDPLVLEDLYGTFTGYPFARRAKLETSDTLLQKILDIGWRTARLCAVETYMDCPYFEQLQYAGDTRIQALVSLYNSGDDRLVRNAIDLLDLSRTPEGVTQSRYPSNTPQYIPPFSLWYIGMLHDYLYYGKDVALVKEKLPGVRQVLHYFNSFQDNGRGSVRNLPGWNFTDWVPGWDAGIAPAGRDGRSAVLDLQLLWAYQLAADMEKQVGMPAFAGEYQSRAVSLADTIFKAYKDSVRNLLADNTAHDHFSEHANALALLTGVVTDNPRHHYFTEHFLADTALTRASVYFKYYYYEALIKEGRGDDYLQWLGKWKENIDMGLTTWAEMSDVASSRSDCHAWGASPNIEIFRTVLGIKSMAPGFAKVQVEPHLGSIREIGGEMPHPAGMIKVHYHYENTLVAEIDLPQGVPGALYWHNKVYPLHPGKNVVRTK